MDATIDLSMVLAVVGATSTVAGAWLTFRRLSNDAEKKRKTEAATILQAAKEADAKMETIFNGKIDSLRKDLENLSDNVDKDMHHMRETYNGEIRNLGEKIEDLRTELRDQHGQLVKLLTTMISSVKD